MPNESDRTTLDEIGLDRIDPRILNELQQDGRIQNIELAKRVGLSASQRPL